VEPRELLHVGRIVGTACDLTEPPLDPRSLCLERQRLGVTVRQRRLDRVERGRTGPVLGHPEQPRNLVPQRHPAQNYRTATRAREWAARPIFRHRSTHST
jgi:hypothetical protein